MDSRSRKNRPFADALRKEFGLSCVGNFNRDYAFPVAYNKGEAFLLTINKLKKQLIDTTLVEIDENLACNKNEVAKEQAARERQKIRQVAYNVKRVIMDERNTELSELRASLTRSGSCSSCFYPIGGLEPTRFLHGMTDEVIAIIVDKIRETGLQAIQTQLPSTMDVELGVISRVMHHADTIVDETEAGEAHASGLEEAQSFPARRKVLK